jgi:hypothetical protein
MIVSDAQKKFFLGKLINFFMTSNVQNNDQYALRRTEDRRKLTSPKRGGNLRCVSTSLRRR